MDNIGTKTTERIVPQKVKTLIFVKNKSFCKYVRINKMNPNSSARWINTTDGKHLKTVSNESTKVIGKLATDVTYWTCDNALLTVVDDDNNIRDLFDILGVAIVQKQTNKVKSVTDRDNFTCNIKQSIASRFPELFLELDFQWHI